MIKRLTHIDPLKCAKCVAVIHGTLAFVAVLFFLLIYPFVLPAGAHGVFTVGPYSVPVKGNQTTLPGGAFAVIVLPLISTVYGWLGGFFVALVYNGAARWTGGLRFTFEDLPSDDATTFSQASI